MKELAAMMMLRASGGDCDAAAIKKLLGAVEIECDDAVVDALCADTKEMDIDSQVTSGRTDLKLFESLGGGPSTGAATGGETQAADAVEEEEEESSAAAGGMFGGSSSSEGSGSDSDSDSS